jgi:TPR repeat protein
MGTEVDYAQALLWYRKAASLFDAKVALGDMYYFGQGVARNPREAFRWYEQAVVQHEDAYVMYSLGFCLLHGHGAKRDLRAALRWLRRAALMGEANAQHELGCAYYRGTGVAKNLKLAMKWLRMAAGHGHEEAKAFLERVGKGARLN